MPRGKKTSERKVRAIAQAKAIDEEASSIKLATITGVPASTIRDLIRDDGRFGRFVNIEKKRLKIEYMDLIQEHIVEMRKKMPRAAYRDLVGGFKIVHEKAFPEDSQPEMGSFKQQINIIPILGGISRSGKDSSGSKNNPIEKKN
jgi:hypothetical protein